MHYSLFQLVFVFEVSFYSLICITCKQTTLSGHQRGVPRGRRGLSVPVAYSLLKYPAFCVVASNREEVEVLLPPLEPQYCVEQAMNAILVDQPLVCIPRLTYLPVISRA